MTPLLAAPEPAVVYLSGQAGRALVEHDGRIAVLSLESPQPSYPVLGRRALWLAGATDVEVETTDRIDWGALHRRLYVAWRVDRTVQLVLVALDGALSAGLRVDAAALAERYLRHPTAGPVVRRRLFAVPLPDVADVDGLRELAAAPAATAERWPPLGVLRLVADLASHRVAATVVAAAWDEACRETGEPHGWPSTIRLALVDHGTFERFTRAVADDGAVGAWLARSVPAWMDTPRLRRLMDAWLARVQSRAGVRRRSDERWWWTNDLELMDEVEVGDLELPALLHGARRGAPGHLGQLYRRYHERLRDYVNELASPEDADEIVDDVFLSQLRGLDPEKYQAVEKVAPLFQHALRSLAKQRILDRTRHLRKWTETELPADLPSADSADHAVEVDDLRAVLLHGLPARQREAWELHEQGFRSWEIAERLDVSAVNAMTLVHRARRHLQARLPALV